MYFDAHTHPHFAAFKDDYREAIQRGLDAGVGMILVGTQKDTSRHSVEVAREFSNAPVYAAVGLHPVHTGKSFHDAQELGEGDAAKAFVSRGEEFDYEHYKTLAQDPKVVAIGEFGLDYYRLEEDTKQKQFAAFDAQVALAHDVQKPLMIHCRNAFPDLIARLSTARNLLLADAGIIHFFTGTVEDARALLELGFSFTFGGVVTFPPKKGQLAGDYDEVVKFIPLDRILSETDAPYVAPVPYRGKRNEPMYVVEVVKKLAELKGISAEEMQGRIWENAKRVFGI